MIEGAQCTLDVAADLSATLTFNIKGAVEPCDIDIANPNLIKEQEF